LQIRKHISKFDLLFVRNVVGTVLSFVRSRFFFQNVLAFKNFYIFALETFVGNGSYKDSVAWCLHTNYNDPGQPYDVSGFFYAHSGTSYCRNYLASYYASGKCSCEIKQVQHHKPFK
jgi:hypothetical protein